MFVCICNQVTDKQIRQCVADGVCSFASLSVELDVGTCCGKCKSCAKKILREAMRDDNRVSQADAGVYAGRMDAAVCV